MVVKVKESAAAPSSCDPLRGVQSSIRKSSSSDSKGSTELEFSRLKNLVPAISRKSSVSKLDVILEAIRYIDQLQDQLLDQIQDKKFPLSAAHLLVGKENTDASLLFKLQQQAKRNNNNNNNNDNDDHQDDQDY